MAHPRGDNITNQLWILPWQNRQPWTGCKPYDAKYDPILVHDEQIMLKNEQIKNSEEHDVARGAKNAVVQMSL